MALKREKAMKAMRRVLLPALAACLTTAWLTLAAAPAEAASWLSSACTAAEANVSLIFAVLAGFAAAFAILALIFRERARSFAHQTLSASTHLDTLATVEDNYRALASLEPQACVIWSDAHARLALHTMPAGAGVPGKLPMFLRFGAWLHPDDAGRVAASLAGCRRGARPSFRTQAHSKAMSSKWRARCAAPKPCCGCGRFRL